MEFFSEADALTTKWGLDIDGTITAAPTVLRIMSASLMKTGNEVIIITACMPGGPAEHNSLEGRTKQLTKLGFKEGTHYTRIELAHGDTDKEVARQKAQICKELQIDIMLDDLKVNAHDIQFVCPVLLMKKEK